MKEKLYTIPVHDAFMANDECPFCFLEKKLEDDLLDFTLGSSASYMESDIRDATDRAGFCRLHFQKMFQYGNTLGNAWILKTHYRKINQELASEIKHFKPVKMSYLDKFKKQKNINNSMTAWVTKKQESCYICNQFEELYARYLGTFFHMYETDSEFRDMVKNSKGFCLIHFSDLCQEAVQHFSPSKQEEFFSMLFPLMQENMLRIGEDVSWLVEKFDYQNKDADWKNSRDAVQRGMQKLKSGYPAEVKTRK